MERLRERERERERKRDMKRLRGIEKEKDGKRERKKENKYPQVVPLRTISRNEKGTKNSQIIFLGPLL